MIRGCTPRSATGEGRRRIRGLDLAVVALASGLASAVAAEPGLDPSGAGRTTLATDRIETAHPTETSGRAEDVLAFYTAQVAEVGVSPAAVAAVPGVALAASGQSVVAPEAIVPSERSVPSLAARAWGVGFGYGSRLGADARGAALRTRGGGFTLGIDRFLDPSLLAGISLSVSRGETRGIGVRTDTESVSGAAYASWLPFGGWELEGLLGVNRAGIESMRVLIIDGIASRTRGSSDGLGLTAIGDIGYRARFPTSAGEAFVKPFAALAYTGQERGRFSEFGLLGPGLFFPSKTFERASGSFGVATGLDMSAGDGWTVRPELRLAWSRYLFNPSPAVPAFLGDVPLVLRDPEPGRNAAVIGLELTAWKTTNLQLFTGYAGEFRSNATAHQGRLGVRLTW